MGRARRRGLRVRADESASPAHVQTLATLARAVLEAADIGPAGPDFTLVVNNYSLAAELRAQTDAAAERSAAWFELLRNPEKEIERDPGLAPVALELSKLDLKSFKNGLIISPLGSRRTAILNRGLTRRLEAAAESDPATVVHGSTHVTSQVLQAGRRAPGAAMKVRILLDDKMQDVTVAEGCPRAPLHQALQDGGWCMLQLEAGWRRSADGLRLDPRQCSIVNAVAISFANGKDALRGLLEAAPSLRTIDASDLDRE